MKVNAICVKKLKVEKSKSPDTRFRKPYSLTFFNTWIKKDGNQFVVNAIDFYATSFDFTDESKIKIDRLYLDIL